MSAVIDRRYSQPQLNAAAPRDWAISAARQASRPVRRWDWRSSGLRAVRWFPAWDRPVVRREDVPRERERFAALPSTPRALLATPDNPPARRRRASLS